MAVWWFFPDVSPFSPKDQASHLSFGSNTQLQQHGQLSVPRTWAFGLARSRNHRLCLCSGQGISGKMKKYQPRLMEEDLQVETCWMPAHRAHGKPADFHILLLQSISALVALGFQTMTEWLQVAMAKRQNMQVKQVNSLLMLLVRITHHE